MNIIWDASLGDFIAYLLWRSKILVLS